MKSSIGRGAAFAFIYVVTSYALSAQETAARYFETVSEQYESISDYTADLVITRGARVETAALHFKKPNLLRLDFSEPADMVMAVDGETLQVWVPEHRVTFEQPLRRLEQMPAAAIAGFSGLELMQRYYTVAYAESPLPVPIDPGSSETVVVLRLKWKSNNEGFRQLDLSIDPAMKMIRRAEGIKTSGERIVFDFTNIVLNRGIPDARFSYDSPPIGNIIENFLFDPED